MGGSTTTRRRLRGGSGLSLRRKLVGIAGAGVACTIAVSVAAITGMQRIVDASDAVAAIAAAERHVLDADMMHDALRGDVYRAIIAADRGASLAERRAIASDTHAHAARLRRDLEAARGAAIDEATAASLATALPALEAFATTAEAMAEAAVVDADAASVGVAEFERAYKAAEASGDRVATDLDEAVATAAVANRTTRDAVIGQQMLGALVTLILLGFMTAALGRAIVRRLAALGQTAGRVVDGDLSARAAVGVEDEIGRGAVAFNEMADSLTAFVERLEAEAERDGFGTQLVEALDMADEESAAHAVVERAMAVVAPETPMELLLSDSSRATLERVVASAAGAPGCTVQSPYSCVAVRRGNPVTFETSEALNACPFLRDRPEGPRSAVCVPVTFMGRALGVLHAAGPDLAPLGDAEATKLTTLATQAGSRIGTVRAFNKSQLQAATDGLTGLINRRTLENRLRELTVASTPNALAMCDLDHFKKLNDRHGHDAGDRALRLFSHILTSTIRDHDIAARQGGEEFVLVLTGVDRHVAAGMLDRLRANLAAAHDHGQPSFTASFGVADSNQAGTPTEIMRLADAALYRAKDNGRDRVEVAGGLHAAESGERVIAEEVAAATERDCTPRLHDAFDDPDPRPTGVEIR